MELEETGKALNEYQKEAVEDESKACLVKANVGSGKTTVLVAKILYLHYKKQVPYEKMVVLTFTNKAADEIRERLAAMETAPGGGKTALDAAALSGFGTFHSVALRLLRDRLPVETLGYRRDFTVIEPEEEADIAESLIAEHKLKIKYKNRLKKRLEQEKKGWQQGREESRYKDGLFRLFALLEEEKIRQNKFSFSDLIDVSTALLKDMPAQARPDWVIVDEVQDSDQKQLAFLSALMGEETRLFAVGDPNQVIYSWRGSEENIFFLLSRQFHARELTLPVNYRSSDTILEAARCFQQGGERLLGTRGAGERIHVRNHYDPFAEAQYLAERIAGLHREGTAWRQIAVFYRLQNQSELLEKVFARYGIPCAVSVKKTVADLPALAWFVKVLRFSCNTRDRFIGEAVRKDRQYGTAPGLYERMLQFEAWAAQRMQQCPGWKTACCAGGASLTDGAGAADIPQEIYGYFDLDVALKPSSASFLEEKEQILSFCGRILEYTRQEGLDLLNGMRTFLNSAALYGVKILQKEADEQEDSVRLMTLHASKGLEFRCVFMIGVNYGLIPLQSKSFEEEEEERRLFFVGITRARDYLELSYYTEPGQARVMSGESRYLEMIPRHLLLREDRKKTEAADLAQLRRAVQEAKMQKRQEEAAGQRDKTGQQEPADSACRESAGSTCRESAGSTGQGAVRQVRHARYGVGIVKRDNESKITVEFENYGEKEFIKAFTKLEVVV